MPRSIPNQTIAHRAQRILIVSSELPPGPGGIGSHAFDLSRALHAQGRDVSLLGSQDYATDAARKHFNAESPVPIAAFITHRNPIITAIARFRQITAAIRSFRPDVILASGGRVLWLTSLACSGGGTPFIAVVHGTELGGPAWQRKLTAMALRRAAAVVAVSKFTSGLVQSLGVASSKVTVIHNGADGERFHPDSTRRSAFRDRLGLGDAPMILTVGNVTQRKGQHLVVEALPDLLNKVPDVHYVTVGRATTGDQLERRARELGVVDRLHVVGQLSADEVIDAHCSADVFAMTSTNTASGDVEGFGIAVTEAALCGVPAVVSRGTGAEEAVADGVSGVVVDPEPGSIAEGLAGILADDPTRQRLGSSAEQRARSTGTWSALVEPYGALLETVVSGNRPRLVVISHTDHYRATDGTTVGFGPTLRELDHLATLTSELVHIAPLRDGPPPGLALPITAPNVVHVPVPTAGGPRAVDRILAIRVVPTWVKVIRRELAAADVVHVRAPAGIALVAMAMLSVRRRPRDRWIKYAGNWAPNQRDAFTYRLQRSWLRSGLTRSVVTVNGRWPDQPAWIRAFDNPTLTETELRTGSAAAEERPPGPPYRAIFVGRLESEKGADTAVDTVVELRRRGLDVRLDLVGDGPLRDWVGSRIEASGDASIVHHGWLPRTRLETLLADAHLMLLPTSASEGFPKVLGEALAFGCVPVTTGISSIGQVLGETGGAVVVDPDESWADVVEKVLTDGSLTRLSSQGITSAARFSYATYLERVREVARNDWGRSL